MKKKVLLVQLPMPQFAYHKLWGNIPLGGGYLKASALNAGLSDLFDIKLLEAKTSCLDSDARLIKRITSIKPDILGLTLYYWNGFRSLHIARRVKDLLPDMKVIVGGPEVTEDSEYILGDGTVDMGCIGQGERTFVDVLKAFAAGEDYSSVHGIFFRSSENVVFNPPGSPFKHPENIPSPYLTGVIDPKDYDRAWLETQRGCPFNCKYCTWKIQSPIKFPLQRILDEIKMFKRRGIRQVKVLNGSFILEPDFEDICKGIKTINKDRQLSFVVYVPVEQVDEKKAGLLRDINCYLANIGLQSVTDEALSNVERRLNTEKFIKGCRLLMNSGISLEIDTIIGLPGDTLEGFGNTVNFIKKHGLDAGPNQHLLFLLSMMPGAPLRQEAEQHKIEFDPLPPYFIKSTETMSEVDLETAVKRANDLTGSTVLDKRDFYFKLVTESHPDIEYNQSIETRAFKGRNPILRVPVNKLLARLDSGVQTPDQWEKISKEIRDTIRQPFTAWFKTTVLDRDLDLISAFCNPLFRTNPYLILTILIETDNKFSISSIDRIKKNTPVKEIIYRTFSPLQALELCILLSWVSPQFDKEWLAQFVNKATVYWLIKITDKKDWKQDMEGAIEAPFCQGVLIEVDEKVGLEKRASILHHVFQRYQNSPKNIHFRNLELESAYMGYNGTTNGYSISLPWYLESILTLDRDLGVCSLHAPGKRTIQDLFAYQLLMQRKLKV